MGTITCLLARAGRNRFRMLHVFFVLVTLSPFLFCEDSANHGDGPASGIAGEHGHKEGQDPSHKPEEGGHGPSSGQQEEKESAHSNLNAGPDHAVLKADHRKGIQLSMRSLELCDIRFAPTGKYKEDFPPGSRVQVSNLTLVYVRKGVWIFPVRIKDSSGAHQSSGSGSPVHGEELPALHHAKDVDWSESEIAVKNVDLIHLALLEAFGASGSGHGH